MGVLANVERVKRPRYIRVVISLDSDWYFEQRKRYEEAPAAAWVACSSVFLLRTKCCETDLRNHGSYSPCAPSVILLKSENGDGLIMESNISYG